MKDIDISFFVVLSPSVTYIPWKSTKLQCLQAQDFHRNKNSCLASCLTNLDLQIETS